MTPISFLFILHLRRLEGIPRRVGIEQERMEFSSGCESGWTMYLGQSAEELTSVSARNDATGGCYQEVEDVEDLSMVSDASSGPPVFHEEEEEEQNYCKENVQQKNGQWKKIQRKGGERHNTVLDDTASSHALGFFKVSMGKNWVVLNSRYIPILFYLLVPHLPCYCQAFPS